MLSSSASAILRLGGWSYVPDFATRQALAVLHSPQIYALLHRAAPAVFAYPVPPPRTPGYARQYRLTFAVVVLGYLTYNLVEASAGTRPNFYEILGVGPQAGEGEMKAAFRAFARRNHPDRVMAQGGVNIEQVEERWRQVREVYEALKDPVVRFAYDRFGEDVLGWKQCTTVREYLRHGLVQSSGFHIVTGVALLLFGAVGKPSPVAFWRYILFFTLFASELALLLSPSPAPASSPSGSISDDPTYAGNVMTALFPRRVPYQHVLLLHQVFVFLSVALSRVAPVLVPGMMDDGRVDAKVLQQVVERVSAGARGVEREVMSMLQLELCALHRKEPALDGSGMVLPEGERDPAVMQRLEEEMERMVVEARLRREAERGPLRSAWETAVRRGREALTPRRERADPFESMSPANGTPMRRRGSAWWERARPSIRIDAVEGEGEERTRSLLPSPSLSPVPMPEGEAEAEAEARLPSPRPSPPPPGRSPVKKRDSYTRGRSVSC